MPASNLTRFHTCHPFGPEGYKTLAYEIFAQLGGQVPATVVIPTGYGELLFGVTKGFRELRRFGLASKMPRMLSAEPAVRAPLAYARPHTAVAARAGGVGGAMPAPLVVSSEGGDPPEVLRSIVRAAEGAGAVTLWIASHLFQREPITCAAMTLAASPTIGVVLMAMSPYTVHPVHATMAAATLDEYFPGRVALCFGVGAPRDLEAVALIADQPVATLRQPIQIARTLLAGDTIAFESPRFRIS